MSHSAHDREVEIKLRAESPEQAARKLESAGFHIGKPRVFEDNFVFDDAAHALRQAGALIRVREAGGKGVLTYKGPAAPGRHKDREELETRLEAPQTMRAILGRLGYSPAFRYQKFRTEYSDGHGTATLDETPIGTFVELEGEPAWIDRTATALGFSEPDYITASYLGLYQEDCARRGIDPGDMVFSARV